MLIPALLLFSLGVAVIYSSSPILAIQQFLTGFVGLVLFFIIRSFDYHFFAKFSKIFYIVAIILLITTLVLGIETRGSVRWIPLGLFNFQPSEFAKFILILVFAEFWTKNRASWINIGKSILILFPVSLLIFRQPDLGTTLTVVFIWFYLLLASHISIFKILVMISGLLSLIPLGWNFLQDYQKQRVFSFFSPKMDPQGIGFHVIQSTIAVGSGELFGRGLGRGTQSRLQFLPEFRTDFIFAFIAEELGFVGTLMVLVLYSLIFYVCFKNLSRINDRFGELIVIGVLGMLFFQIAVNIGMNTGILPITGITLPLLSYGGSSIVTTFMSLGLVASVFRFGINKRGVVED